MTSRHPGARMFSRPLIPFTLFAACALLVACGDDDRAPSDGSVRVETGTSRQECRSEHRCENGACECITGPAGDSCCDPDFCGEDDPRSCTQVCAVGECDEPEPTDAGVDRDLSTPEVSLPDLAVPDVSGGTCESPCWDECRSDHGRCTEMCGGGCACWNECRTDHGTCAERCGPGDVCWGECRTDHGTCAERCGAGDVCWGECRTDHGTCAERCGAGVVCWDECRTDHGTCAERCGPGNSCWDECRTD
ncbi:MAG: hypothetical protein AAF411_30990, partial [Myxococcota bacterium]